jgi:hypothetical protein
VIAGYSREKSHDSLLSENSNYFLQHRTKTVFKVAIAADWNIIDRTIKSQRKFHFAFEIFIYNH